MPHQTLQPVAVQERIQTIDIIRGFALFGILIINFSNDLPWPDAPSDGWNSIKDQIVFWPVELFMLHKFVAIFGFLFGLGFSIQMLRAEASGRPFVAIYLRRLIILYLIGVVHQILTQGDVLHDYAIVGIFLLLVRKLNPKLLILLALIFIIGPWVRNTILSKDRESEQFNSDRKKVALTNTILDTYIGVYEIEPGRRIILTREGNNLIAEGRNGRVPWFEFAESDTEFFSRSANSRQSIVKDSSGMVKGFHIHRDNEKNLFFGKINMDIQQAKREMFIQKAVLRPRQLVNQTGTFKEIITSNAKDFWQELKNWSFKNFFWGYHLHSIFPFFLLGLFAGRRQIFQNISMNRNFLLKVMQWGLAIGLVTVSIAFGFEVWEYINGSNTQSFSYITLSILTLFEFFGALILALGYIAVLTLLIENETWKKRLSFLAPVGRMALTNYLLHSVAFAIAFLGYGFGLFGKVGPFWGLMIAIPVFIFQIFASRWWLRRFRFGPVEWLWRSLTYLKFQPMRLKTADKKKVT